MNVLLPPAYELKIDGETFVLPLVESKSNDLLIYNFNLMGKAKTSRFLAEKLFNILKDEKIIGEFDELLAIEAKALGIAQELALMLGLDSYICLRKSKKIYMSSPLSEEVKTITSAANQSLFLDNNDAKLIKGKRIVIVDDIISTGATIKAASKLIERAGGIITRIACVATEGNKLEHSTNFIKLGHIPLHNTKGLQL